jgi:paraquat-inducible protein B
MTDLPVAKTRPASNWSAIWVLPLIALIIGGWLGWRAYNETGIEIQVRFESGEGIQANKTEVMYKGMSVGKVKTLKLDDEGNSKGVIATVEMNKDVEQYLKTSTRFWLVKPSVTLAGITGLETLVSGTTSPSARVKASRPASSRPWLKSRRCRIPSPVCT